MDARAAEQPPVCRTAAPSLARSVIVLGATWLAIAIVLAIPVKAAAGEPDDIAAYQQYGQYGASAPGRYVGAPAYNDMVGRLNYAERQYYRARQSGDAAAAKHWKKEIKHLRRRLRDLGQASGPRYAAPGRSWPMAAPVTPYTLPGAPYTPYAQPYGAPAYPPSGYASAPYGQAPTAGSAGGLGALIGPLLGLRSAPTSQQANPPAYPQAGYPSAPAGVPYGSATPYGSTGSMGDMVNSLVGAMRGGGSAP